MGIFPSVAEFCHPAEGLIQSDDRVRGVLGVGTLIQGFAARVGIALNSGNDSVDNRLG